MSAPESRGASTTTVKAPSAAIVALRCAKVHVCGGAWGGNSDTSAPFAAMSRAGSAGPRGRDGSRIAPEQQRQRDILAAEVVVAREIGDRPRDAQDAVIAADRESSAANRLGEQLLRLRIDPAKAAQLRHREI